MHNKLLHQNEMAAHVVFAFQVMLATNHDRNYSLCIRLLRYFWAKCVPWKPKKDRKGQYCPSKKKCSCL